MTAPLSLSPSPQGDEWTPGKEVKCVRCYDLQIACSDPKPCGGCMGVGVDCEFREVEGGEEDSEEEGEEDDYEEEEDERAEE
ncbi:hypothetical protein VE04_10189, partial [Pseudogymnoascus sp. 24MN13]